jgi:hypothetical protein
LLFTDLSRAKCKTEAQQALRRITLDFNPVAFKGLYRACDQDLLLLTFDNFYGAYGGTIKRVGNSEC